MIMTGRFRIQSADFIGILIFAVIWGGSTAYLAATGADWMFPFIALGVFGIGLSAIGWVLTRGARRPMIEVRRPALESYALLAFLSVYAVAFLTFGMSALREQIAPGRVQELAVLAVKLGVHVAAPAILLLLVGARLRPIFISAISPGIFWRTLIIMSAILVALLAIVSPSLKNINDLNPALTTLAWAAPASFLWLALEAGLNEEFFFRGLLQTRFSAWFKSAWTGVAVTSILFGLAHAPGLYLRGGPEVEGWSSDPVQVVAYSIATLAPLSVFFGFLYARTNSLLLVVLLHAMLDFLPNLSEFIRIWA